MGIGQAADPDEMQHNAELCLPPLGSGDILFFPGRLSVRLCLLYFFSYFPLNFVHHKNRVRSIT